MTTDTSGPEVRFLAHIIQWVLAGVAPPSGTASHAEYVTGQVPAGGPVKTWASSDVRSETTCRDTTPTSDTDDRVGPSSTGRRPTCSIECIACQSSAADDADKDEDRKSVV